jgi:hypothetical protein
MASISALVSHPTGCGMALLRCDGADVTAPFDMGWIPAADEAGQCPDSRQALIAGLGGASALVIKMSEELQDMLGCEIADGQAFHGFTQLAADKRQ